MKQMTGYDAVRCSTGSELSNKLTHGLAYELTNGLLRLCVFSMVMLSVGCTSLSPAWLEYKQQYLIQGRIQDNGNRNISHSEGQGYGLLLAFYYQDKSAFKDIWFWTKHHLQIRQDKLFAWLWAEEKEGRYNVQDLNNATDGDLLIAWALYLAGHQWNNQDYVSSAEEIANAILSHLVINVDQNQKVLLPAQHGFNKPPVLAWNPSYQVLPAYSTFIKYHPSTHAWTDITTTSKTLLKKAVEPGSGLPMNWSTLTHQSLHLSSNLAQWPLKDHHFGDEAIRVYLYQLWEGNLLLEPQFLLNYFEHKSYLPRYVEGANVAPEEALAGAYAILGANARRLGKHRLADKLLHKAQQRLVSEKPNYYSHTLYLLALKALEQGPL